MKVMVLGIRGLLGHTLARSLFYAGHDVPTTFARAEDDALGADILREQPDALVNCIGVTDKNAPDYWANQEFPHRLAILCADHGIRLVHISSDCVFRGTTGNYAENAIPDALDPYGNSKAIGEVRAPHLTLRTSFVGRAPHRAPRGLLEWFLRHPGPSVTGYRRAFFTGLTAIELSRAIISALNHKELAGIYHVAGPKISKHDLLHLFNAAFRRSLEITPDDEFRVDRSLDGSKFCAATGWGSPSWQEMIREMAIDARF